MEAFESQNTIQQAPEQKASTSLSQNGARQLASAALQQPPTSEQVFGGRGALAPRALSVLELNDRHAFLQLEAEWDALVSGVDDQLFYRHVFLRIWIDNFAPTAKLRILTARDGAGRLAAVLPLYEERAKICGVPVRQLSACANAHSCRFDLVAIDRAAAASAFLDHLRATGGFDVLRLTDVPEAGAAWSLHAAASSAGLAVGTWDSLHSPYVPLPSSFEALSAKLSSKFKANLRRRRKKLEEKGTLTFERVEGGPELAAKLEEGLLLEQSGWKGKRGTAIAQHGRTRGFYSELARTLSYQHRLVLYFLRLDGKAIAFHYALLHQGKYLLLKPGYDEQLKECSPGQLLMEEVLKDCIARKIAEFDFLGPDMTWKQDWCPALRRHTWLFVFSDTTFGRALRTAKFQWAPAAKELLKRWIRK